MGNNIILANQSVLRLDVLYVESFDFKRGIDLPEDENIYTNFQKSFKHDENRVEARLGCSLISDKNEDFTLHITISGIFSLKGDKRTEDMEENIMAIMFPYIRSQVSILTAQPSMTPVVLPVVNINQWFKIQDQ